ncbi:DNA primase [Tropheryma whipplei]|uniref:DNA primase n=1 Tax=Tropheryma whipplei TaxID=2039 RepID=UPI0004AF1DF5|nr:DNA primase [Tropheryma whipplei]
MSKIKQEVIHEIKERANIREIIGEYTNLKRQSAGAYAGLCPFHSERTPSFHVRETGLYHCFGCGKGGDVISFVQEIEGLNFVDAVEQLARTLGITIVYYEGDSMPDSRSNLLAACKSAAEFYSEQLLSSTPAVTFLKSRGFDRDLCERYQIGFSPTNSGDLYKHLRDKGFTLQQAVAAGLLNPSGMDRFRARIVWPVKDVTGNIVGFGARKLAEDAQGPKYINSPESSLYKKNSLLYGFDVAKKAISKKDRVVIVEGYTDVMSCHQSGIDEAVATCGTSWGIGHMRLIKRMLSDSGVLIFAFDGDQAGQHAIMRAFKDSPEIAARSYAAIFPKGLDPCELRIKNGAQAVIDLVERAIPLYEFVINHQLSKCPLGTFPERRAALAKILPFLKEISDRILRDHYTGLVCSRLGIDREQVDLLLPKLEHISSRFHPSKIPWQEDWKKKEFAAPTNPPDARFALEQQVIKSLLQYQHLLERDTAIAMCDYSFHNPTLSFIAQMIGMVIREQNRSISPAEFSKLIHSTVPSEYHATLQALEVLPVPVSPDKLDSYLEGLVRSFENQHLLEEKALLLRQLSSEKSLEKSLELRQRIVELEKQRNSLLPD